MTHRHITDDEWSLMAIDSLFDRGELADWREFAASLKKDTCLARTTLRVADWTEDRGSAALARILVARYHPDLVPFAAGPSRR